MPKLPRADVDEWCSGSDKMYCSTNKVPNARANAIPHICANTEPDAESNTRAYTLVWNRPVLA